MPIYEYRCRECGGELEKLQRMSDAPLVDCPACAKPALQRLISAAGFRLKGGGWYETDFKQGQKRNVADSGESGGTEKGGDSAGKKDGESGGKKDGESKSAASGDDSGTAAKSSKKKDAAPSAGAA